jgi:hypothetical protein
LSEQTAQEQTAPKQSDAKYPVSEHFKVLDGYDIYRSNNLIVALVAVEANNRKDLRLYRWQNRQGNWKVDLCRMSVTRWKWNQLAEKAKELTNKYELGQAGTQD